jgi:hypothetical protein
VRAISAKRTRFGLWRARCPSNRSRDCTNRAPSTTSACGLAKITSRTACLCTTRPSRRRPARKRRLARGASSGPAGRTTNSSSASRAPGGTYTYFDLHALKAKGIGHVDQAALLHQGAAGVHAPQRRRLRRHRRTTSRAGQLERQGPAKEEIPFMPGRVVLQDFTGVPCVVDLAAMRDAMKKLGGDPTPSTRSSSATWSSTTRVQVDAFGSATALTINARRSSSATTSATSSSSGGSSRSRTSACVPPATGIVHQVNLEYLAKGVLTKQIARRARRSRTPTRASAPTATPP